MVQKRGKFIVLDGGEGSGKSSVLTFLKENFGEEKFLFTREPGGSPFAEKVRELILSDDAKDAPAETMFALFWAARAAHLKHKVIPALENGINVICDRFDSSTYAYQIKAQDGDNLKDLFYKCREIYLGDYEPDMYIFLDIEPALGLSRTTKRAETNNHFDDRQIEFHQKVRGGIKEFISDKPHAMVDASQPLEVVLKDCENIIKELI